MVGRCFGNEPALFRSRTCGGCSSQHNFNGFKPFNVVFMSIGSSIGIIVGNLLGANKLEEAKDTDRKIIALSVVSCFVFGGLLALASRFIPELYNTTREVKQLSTSFLLVSACIMPFSAFTHACYFTLRSGGQTKITLLFDSCYMWCISIPVAYVLSRFTDLPVLALLQSATDWN